MKHPRRRRRSLRACRGEVRAVFELRQHQKESVEGDLLRAQGGRRQGNSDGLAGHMTCLLFQWA